MAHTNSDVIDSGQAFTVNADRTITIPEGEERIGIYHDHYCNRITFRGPRYYDQHDLSQCMYHFVNYHNLASDRYGRYAITDMAVDPDDNTMIVFSWLPSNIATSAAGEVEISLCFFDTEEQDDNTENITYEWNTEKTGGLTVGEGLEVPSDADETVFPAALSEYLYQIRTTAAEAVGTCETATNAANSVVSSAKSATLAANNAAQTATQAAQAANNAATDAEAAAEAARDYIADQYSIADDMNGQTYRLGTENGVLYMTENS